MGEEIVLSPVDKWEGFLQGDSINLDVCNKACPNYPK